jgi:hypothetical protein
MTGVADTRRGISARAMAVQQYFWYLRAIDPERSSYAMQLALAIDGPLDAARLQCAVAATIARHDGGAAVRARARGSHRHAEAVVDGVVAELQRELDLAAGITIRGRLLRFAPERHVLAFAIDHAVCDGATASLHERGSVASALAPWAAVLGAALCHLFAWVTFVTLYREPRV